MWRLWCYALGKKEGRSQRDADNIALIRTAVLLCYLGTNLFIVAGVIRHWNGVDRSDQCQYDTKVRVKEMLHD